MSSRETSAEIEERAADWAARADRAPLTDAQQAALDNWLAGDTRRLGAYARARAMLVRADAARALGPGYDPAQFLEGDAADDDDDDGGSKRRITRRHMLGLSAVAASAIGLVGVSLLNRHRYSTAVGEMLRVTLDDGTIVNLNTASAMDVAFDAGHRKVILHAGEALFDVAKDASRPFIVSAGGTGVRAIGTSFTVRRDAAKRVDVVVTEGIVEVSQNNVDLLPVRLTENMEAKSDPEGAVPITAKAIDPATVERKLFWREGKIGFSDARLDEASAEFARYSDVRIIIPDSQVAEERVTGLFVATDPGGFADAAAASLGLDVQRSGKTIRIVRADIAAPPYADGGSSAD